MPHTSSSTSCLHPFVRFSILSMIVVPSALSFSIESSTTIGTTKYQLRPYDPERESDRSSLEEICANVYGGEDYLPQKAVSYAADPACSFLALTNSASDDATEVEDRDDNILLAVANYKRLPAQNSAWIEAVRTHPEHRKKGLATALLRSIVDVSKQENNEHKNKSPTNILTCTDQSNKGMISALEKVGFAQCNTIVTMSWPALKQLPGWTPDCDKASQPSSGCIVQPQPLLDALNLNHLVSPAAKSIASSSWCTVTAEHDLLERLQKCKTEGGCTGYLPGLYEYIVPGPNRIDLKLSMEQGLVLALDVEIEGTIEHAILVFTQDERISSLKSNWVCSIVAHTPLAFEAALWHAHSTEVARRMQSFQLGEGDNNRMNKENHISALPFCLVFDDAVPLEKGSLAHALPRVTDECVVLSYDHEGSEQ